MLDAIDRGEVTPPDVGDPPAGDPLVLAEIERLHMPKHWTSEPLAALADLEFAAGNKAKAIELEKKALASTRW